jgi:hypothetical protein
VTPVKNGGDASEAALDPVTTKKHRWIVETYLNPKLVQWPMAEITALPVLKRIGEEGKIETAHRARALASRIFCYAQATGRAPQGDITQSLRGALAPTVSPTMPRLPIPISSGIYFSRLIATRDNWRRAVR